MKSIFLIAAISFCSAQVWSQSDSGINTFPPMRTPADKLSCAKRLVSSLGAALAVKLCKVGDKNDIECALELVSITGSQLAVNFCVSAGKPEGIQCVKDVTRAIGANYATKICRVPDPSLIQCVLDGVSVLGAHDAVDLCSSSP